MPLADIELKNNFLVTVCLRVITQILRNCKWKCAKIAVTRAKPLNSSLDESANEIDHDETSLQRNPLEPKERQQDPALPTNGERLATAPQADTTYSAVGTVIDATVRPVSATQHVD